MIALLDIELIFDLLSLKIFLENIQLSIHFLLILSQLFHDLFQHPILLLINFLLLLLNKLMNISH